MGTVRIEHKLVNQTSAGITVGVGYHSYLVYVPDGSEDASDYSSLLEWEVIQAIRTDNNIPAGNGTPTGYVLDTFIGDLMVSTDQYEIIEETKEVLTTPEDRGAHILALGAAGDALWSRLKTAASSIEDLTHLYDPINKFAFEYPYVLNSNSYIRSVFEHAGLTNFFNNLPKKPFFDVRPTPGLTTLIGTESADVLTGEFPENDNAVPPVANRGYPDVLVGGAGNDTLKGGKGRNILDGGVDDDTFIIDKASEGNILIGGEGNDLVDYSAITTGIQFDTKPVGSPGPEDIYNDNVPDPFFLLASRDLDDSVSGFFNDSADDRLFSIETIIGSKFIDTLTIDELRTPEGQSGSDFQLKIQNFGGEIITKDEEGNDLPWEKVIQKVLDIETEFELNIDADGKGVINFDGGETITLEGFNNSGTFEDKPIAYIKGSSDKSVINVQSEGSYLLDVSEGKGEVTVGDGLDWIIVGGPGQSISLPRNHMNPVVSLQGNEPTYTISGGDAEDRIFVKGSMVGLSPDSKGQEKLFPLLGGVSVNIEESFRSQLDEYSYKFEDVYDIDSDGNVEYYFETRAYELERSNHPELGINDAFLRKGEELFAETNAKTVYEMEGSDLIVYSYTTSRDSVDFALKILGFNNGDYGINLSGPFNVLSRKTETGFTQEFDVTIQTTVDDNAFSAANTAIRELTKSSNYEEILPVFEEEDTQSPNASRNIQGTENDDVSVGGNGDDTIDAKGGHDRAFGGAGNDHITVGDGNDVAYGGEGDDIIVGGSGQGDDFYDGGEGTDTIIYSSASNTIFVNLENGSAFGDEIDSDSLTSLENIVSGDGDDRLTGDEGSNQITGAGGNDRIDGKDGEDTVIYSGARADYQIISLSSNRVRITDLRQDSPDGTDEVSNVEKFSFADGTFTSDALFSANNKPTIISDDLQINEDESITFTKEELLLNDSDPDGDAISFVSAQSAENGQLIENSDGTFTFIPDQDFNGTASFIYTITDGNGVEVSSTVNVEVAAVNDAPVVQTPMEDQNSAEDRPVNIVVPETLFSDVDGDQLTLSASLSDGTALPSWLAFDPETKTFTGTPPTDFNGSFNLKISATDGIETIESEFALNIFAVNDGPEVGNDEGFEVASNTPLTISALALLANDTDAEGDELTVSSVGSAFNGTVEMNAEGQITFTPTDGYAGPAYFLYTVTDEKGGIGNGIVTLEVTAPNSAPIVQNEIEDQAIDEDSNWSFTVPEDIFSDVDGDTLTLTASLVDGTELPTWLSFDSNTQTFSGTPPQDFIGDINLRVSASDGEFEVSEGFTLTINPVNDAPIIVQEISDQTSDEDTSWSFTIPAGTFSDVDGDTLTLTATLVDGAELPAWLSFDSAAQTFSGTPPKDLNGEIALRVTASDGELEVSDDFNLTINPVNDAPVAANDDSFETNEDTPLTITANSLLLNDADVDGDDLSIFSVEEITNGSVAMNNNGDIIFTPTLNYNGPASFRYTVSDGNGGSATAVASLTIHAVNDAPTNLISSTLEIEENSLAGAEVGMFSVTDVDLEDTHTYSIVGGTGANQFAFDGNKLVVAEGADLDFETITSLTLDVLTTDAAGLTTQNSFEITLLDDPTDNNGNTSDDIIYGAFQNDILDGQGGNDTIFGLWGDDHLIGGTGADKLYGGFGSDTADYSGSSAGVNVSLVRSYWWWGSNQSASGGDAEGDQLFSIENLIGSNHDDQLKGNWKNNRLEGGEGNDFLTGGWGRDQFVFKSGDDVDTITDFDTGYSFWGFHFSGDKIIL
ncbi:MAG: tandem-95 repeat protein, partial [Rhizobiales bacterium]|nr:tandem-95 repeat protein [Hyphomicrobiales bacterium]